MDISRRRRRSLVAQGKGRCFSVSFFAVAEEDGRQSLPLERATVFLSYKTSNFVLFEDRHK